MTSIAPFSSSIAPFIETINGAIGLIALFIKLLNGAMTPIAPFLYFSALLRLCRPLYLNFCVPLCTLPYIQ